MRTAFLSLLLFAPLALGACSPASLERKEQTDAAVAQPDARVEPVASRGKRIELVNNARRGKLVKFEVAPIADRENFREVAAARGLPQDDERRVAVGPGCVYDARAVMENGSTLTQYRLDVCFRNRVFLGDFPALNEPPQMSGPGPEPQ